MAIDPSVVVRPARLRPGDCIGVVAPASPVADPSRTEAGVRYFERAGYRVKLGKHISDVHGYLAGTDQDRVADLHAMVADPEVKAVLCVRGGYGVTRLLPLIDFELFCRNPKIIMGFSDITALQLALWQRCHLVTFHGPMVAVDFAGSIDALTETSFWETVTGADHSRSVPLGKPESLLTLRRGKAVGRLLGGNLSLMAALAGTPFLPSFTDSLSIIEEIGEEPYRVDRMFQQLLQAGTFDGVRGVLTGQFTDCEPKDSKQPSLSVNDLHAWLAERLQVPFLAGCDFGHVTAKVTLPVGVLAEIDTDNGTLHFHESAVF